jgi:hypothetical protein
MAQKTRQEDFYLNENRNAILSRAAIDQARGELENGISSVARPSSLRSVPFPQCQVNLQMILIFTFFHHRLWLRSTSTRRPMQLAVPIAIVKTMQRPLQSLTNASL